MSRILLVLMGTLGTLSLLVACSTMSADTKLNLTTAPSSLQPCPDYPRCVSTEAQDPQQRMTPFRYEGSQQAAQERLRQIVQGMPRTKIVVDVPGYLATTFTTRLVRYTDDVEFLFDKKEPIIHFRSGARIGYYDFGTNRERMELIIKTFQASPAG